MSVKKQKFISPSTLKTTQNPINYVLKRTLYGSSTEPVLMSTGSIHSVLEEAFKTIIKTQKAFVEKGKMPGTEQIRKLLDGVTARAKYMLQLRGGKTQLSDFKFAKEMIDYYGGKILSNPTITAFTETPLTSTAYSSSYILRAVPDLVLVENLRKEAGRYVSDAVTVVDWKSYADKSFTKFYALSSDPQKTMLRVLAGEIFGTENVDFVFATNREFLEAMSEKDPRVRRELMMSLRYNVENKLLNYTVLNKYTDETLANDREMLRHAVSQAEVLMQMSRDIPKIKARRRFARFVEDVLEGEDGPACDKNCKSCLIRELCPYGEFMQMVTEYPISGEKWAEMYPSKVKRIVSSDDFSELMERYRLGYGTYSIEWLRSIKEFREKLPGTYNVLMESMRANRAYAAEKFIESVVGPVSSLPPQLPFLITDTDLAIGHLDRGVKYSLEREVRSYLEFFSKTVGFGKSETKEFVSLALDKVLRSRKIAATLFRDMYQNAAKSALGEDIVLNRLPYERQLELVRDAERSFTRESVLSLFGEIDRESIDIVRTLVGEEELVRRLGVGRGRKLLEARRISEIMTPFEKELLASRAESFVGKMRTFPFRSSLYPESIFSIAKLPLPMLTASGILIWALNHISYAHQLRNAAKKAIGTAELQREKEIEASTHYSSYQSVRRLLLSDMGSPVRIGVLKAGRLVSEFIKNPSHYFREWKDVLTRAFTTIKYDTSTVVKSIYASLDEKLAAEFLDTDYGRLFKYGAAAGLVVGVVPLLAKAARTAKSASEERLEQRKMRIKRFVEHKTYTYSQMRTPESNLREGYKLHTPFGSVTMRHIINSTFDAFEYFLPTAGNIMKMIERWKTPWMKVSEVRSHVLDQLIKRRQGIAEAATLRILANTPEKILAKEMRDAVGDITQATIDARANIIRRKSIAMLRELRGTKNPEKIVEEARKAIDAVTAPTPLRERKPLTPHVHPIKGKGTRVHQIVKFADRGKSAVARRLPLVKTNVVLPRMHPETLLDVDDKVKTPKDISADVGHMLTKRAADLGGYNSRAQLIKLQHYPTRDQIIVHHQPSSGMSKATERAFSSLITPKVASQPVVIDTPGSMQLLQPTSRNMSDLSEHVSRMLTTRTRQVARNYSYGGYNTGRFARLLFGEGA